MADLARLTHDALDRGLRAAGWKPVVSDTYERRVNRRFGLQAQFWIDGDPVIARADQVEEVVAGVLAQLEAAGERMGVYADVDAFAAALEAEEDTRDDAPIIVPALLAATGREREARERARPAPGEFAERLDGWLRGERSPSPPGSTEFSIDWREVVAKARERHAEPPEVRAQRPQASWGDVLRTGRGLVRTLREELPPTMPIPARDGAWEPVELDHDAQAVLEAARRAAPLPLWQNAWVEARIEPDGRVLLDGAEVGTVAARGEAAAVPGKIERHRRDGPLELSVQLR